MSSAVTIFFETMWRVIIETFNLFRDIGLVLLGSLLSIIFTVTGGESEVIKALLICMICDYISGVVKAVKYKKLNFYAGFFGIFKKIVIIVLITAVNELDIILGLTGSTVSCKFVVTCFYVSNEIVSILENAAAIGIQVPKQLMKMLEHLQNLDVKK